MVAGDVVNTAARCSPPRRWAACSSARRPTSGRSGSSLPARPTGRGEGKEAPVPAWLALRPTAASASDLRRTGSDDRARPRARHAHGHLGPRRRRAERASRHGLRPGRDRQVAPRAEFAQLVAGQGGRVIRGRSPPYGDSDPVRRVRRNRSSSSRGIFDSDDAARGVRETRTKRSPRSPDRGGGGARTAPRDAPRPR